MVVNDVEHDREALAMASVDEALESERSAIRGMRRVRIGAVVTPVASAGKCRNRHKLYRRDAQLAQVWKPTDRALERPLGREGSGMKLVDDEVFQGRPFQSRSVHAKASGSTIREA